MNLIAEGVTIMITKLYLMPTQLCNCSCTYCYIPHHERSKKAEYTFLSSAVTQFTEELKQNDINKQAEIRFIGGEPYLEFEHLLKITDYFLTEIKTGQIVINSNGTLITENSIKRFNVNQLERIIHIISLDGLERKHNGRRKLKNGNNAYSLAVNGIKLLQKYKMPVFLNMVLDEYTLDGFKPYLEFLKHELNIHQLSVSLLFNPNKKTANETKFQLLKEVYKFAADYEVLIGGHHRLLLGAKIPELLCRAGEQTILLSGDKKIYACQRFVGREEADIFGNDSKFSEISCSACVGKNCYSQENNQLGEKIFNLYQEKYPEYLRVNAFDKILFGVI